MPRFATLIRRRKVWRRAACDAPADESSIAGEIPTNQCFFNHITGLNPTPESLATLPELATIFRKKSSVAIEDSCSSMVRRFDGPM